MRQFPAHEEPVPSTNTQNQHDGLHRIGGKVAHVLRLTPQELTVLAPGPAVPNWQSKLRVAELAYDSVALASLTLALLGHERGKLKLREQCIMPTASRVQASFGSEKLFQLDGATPAIWAALSGFWKVRDGWVRTHGNYPHHAARLAQLLGVSAQAERADVETAMLQWSRFDLEAQAADTGALAIAVRTPGEWHQHPQYGVLAQQPIVDYAAAGNAAPRPWTSTGELPLSGVRVLDLTRVIAGPVATRDLAVAGADVLRVDSPKLPETAWQHLDTGHEKRTTLLDLDNSHDFATLQQLLADADVVVHGYRPTALAKYGLDFESLHQRYPGIVVAQLSAWGRKGPWGDRRGFDSLVQAASGIAVIETKDDGRTPGALPVQALDHSAGHFLAAAIATALRAQRIEGGSHETNISLARIANELLAAGSSPALNAPGSVPELPTESVALKTEDATATVTCPPPVLDFPGAPSTYRSPLHSWGTDTPGWVS